MKSFQEKEKKLYELLAKLNNFDTSQIQTEVQIEIDKGMQAYLEEYYYYDMNSSDMTADEVTKKAEKGLYQIEYDGETYVLSPNFYQQDITKRYNRFDTERRHSNEQERIQEIKDNFAKYKIFDYRIKDQLILK